MSWTARIGLSGSPSGAGGVSTSGSAAPTSSVCCMLDVDADPTARRRGPLISSSTGTSIGCPSSYANRTPSPVMNIRSPYSNCTWVRAAPGILNLVQQLDGRTGLDRLCGAVVESPRRDRTGHG